MRFPGYFRQNDTAPLLDAVLTDADGQPIDVTGATVRFRATARGSASPKVDAAAEVVSGSAGQVRYRPQSGDFDTPGEHWCEFEVTWTDGRVETFPNDNRQLVLVVTPELG